MNDILTPEEIAILKNAVNILSRHKGTTQKASKPNTEAFGTPSVSESDDWRQMYSLGKVYESEGYYIDLKLELYKGEKVYLVLYKYQDFKKKPQRMRIPIGLAKAIGMKMMDANKKAGKFKAVQPPLKVTYK